MDRLFVSDAAEWLLPSPLYALVILAVMTVFAFRVRGTTVLRRFRWPLACMLCWCYLTTTPAVVNLFVSKLESRYSPAAGTTENGSPYRTIAVLASGDSFDPDSRDAYQLDLAGMRRTLAAVDLRRRSGGMIVFVGSAYRNEPVPVARRMAALARFMGVDDGDIRAATGSLNTRQNLEQLEALLGDDERVILVTSAIHMPRAMAVAETIGLNAVANPCDFRGKRDVGIRGWFPNNGAFLQMAAVLHEYLGYGYYRVRGWIA